MEKDNNNIDRWAGVEDGKNSTLCQNQPVFYHLGGDHNKSFPLSQEDEILNIETSKTPQTPWMLTDFSRINETNDFYDHSRQASKLSANFLGRESSSITCDQWEWDNECCFGDETNAQGYIDPDQLEHLMVMYPWLKGTDLKYGDKN